MKKILLLTLLPFLLIASEQVEINADQFEADEKKRVSHFKGSVHIKKGKDEIKADYVKIDFDQKNRPLKYEATGSVTFDITTDSQHFEGKSDKIIYNPSKATYEALGNVFIKETTKEQKLKGASITINRNSGKTKISGSKNRPVKFTFTVDE